MNLDVTHFVMYIETIGKSNLLHKQSAYKVQNTTHCVNIMMFPNPIFTSSTVNCRTNGTSRNKGISKRTSLHLMHIHKPTRSHPLSSTNTHTHTHTRARARAHDIRSTKLIKTNYYVEEEIAPLIEWYIDSNFMIVELVKRNSVTAPITYLEILV